MYGIANCTISVLRGTSTDQWGDTTDSGTVIASGIPALIMVRSSSVYDPSTQTARVVQSITGEVLSTTDIVNTDQIRDDTNGITYIVESVTQPGSPGHTPDLQLELRRVK